MQDPIVLSLIGLMLLLALIWCVVYLVRFSSRLQNCKLESSGRKASLDTQSNDPATKKSGLEKLQETGEAKAHLQTGRRAQKISLIVFAVVWTTILIFFWRVSHAG